MLFICLLLALGAIAALIFATPLKAKVWTALALIAAGTLWCAAKAVGVLAGAGIAGGATEALGVPDASETFLASGAGAQAAAIRLWSTSNAIFGTDTGSMDALSALFVLLIAIGAISVVLYARGYVAHYLATKSSAHISLHYTALTVMVYAMLGVVCSDGGFSFLFFWELMTVASFMLILFDAERREVRRAALAYLIMMHIGFALLLIGFVRLDVMCGSADFAQLGGYFQTQPATALLLVFLAGFGMKAGMFPLHVWLPEAHPAAPSHVSALMSGVMIKMGIYGILRVLAQLTDLPMLHTAGIVLLVAGIATGLWGVILAAMQNDVKRLLAYSSIENIGIVLLGLGVACMGKSAGSHTIALLGFSGAILHTLNHSLFKSLLFLGAGNIRSATHTTSLDALGGLGKHMPVTALLFLVGTAAICALPPLNGFVSELLIYLGMLDGIALHDIPLAAGAGIAALALIGGLVVLTFTKLYGTVFLGAPRTHEVAEAREVDGFRIAAMAVPLTGIVLIGLFPQYVVGLVTRAAGAYLNLPAGVLDYQLSPILVGVSRTAWLLLAVIGLLVWLRRRALRTRNIATGATWGCGFTAPNVRMQYTGESFSEGLESLAKSLTHASGEGGVVGRTEIFPRAHNFDIRHKDRVDRLFAAWWVELLRVINKRAMRLRTGKINHYVLFALIFLVLVFLLSLLNLI